ncbi:alpha/beta fold hydrolase [Mycobacteroides salmoniphilum]|uniref:Alpha/beta hydrolase family protein n=1 Tax=Mycobacteroides salmoniphilum TaxID=404941 RepID=A0A4R8SPZ5_9MYCO|nr:alpha/beta hydrolase [Mycobacteroides salmoniphilum]TEA01089.1 Alpha/beta hydrolase family protein [Mycobacteroides salmoniphilum]
MPGTGSDDDFITRAFGPALSGAGATLVAVRPEPNDLVNGYLRALDRAARGGPIVVGGMSIGTAVALTWALRNPGATVAVLAAMPAWTGRPENSPASVSARVTAESLRSDGLAAVTAAMQASSPAWLAAELTRSWAVQWPGLPNAMEEVSAFENPAADDIRGLTVPLAVAAATDDPIHPLTVARDWVSWAPHAALRTFTLDQLGADPSCLGRACVGALTDI